MNKVKLYQVREFANIAGVTVRTLQYYDRIGVLQPSQKTEARHRLYARRDLIRLQQILTLKQLGFTLKEIKHMMQRPEYDMRSALKAQKQAIDAQIEQLKNVSSAMEHAMQVLDTTEDWDWDSVQLIIQGMTDRHYLEWIRKYFTDDMLETLAKQSQSVSADELRQAQLKWQSIADRVRFNQHLSPDHPILQSIAQEADALIQAFTQGNVEIHRTLKDMYSQPEDIPPAYQLFDADLAGFYKQVMDIYYQ